MTSGEYKRISELIESGDAEAQKEINMWLLNELKETHDALTTQVALNDFIFGTNSQLKRYIDNMVRNVALCVKADMLDNGLRVTFVDPDKYKEDKS